MVRDAAAADERPPDVVALAPTMQQSEDGPSAEDALEDDVQDFRHFSSLFNKKGFSSQTIRKGEKDFETHGTQAQSKALEQSRQAMEDVLSYTRVHRPNNWCRGWYFPDAWADLRDEPHHASDGVDDHGHDHDAPTRENKAGTVGGSARGGAEKSDAKRGVHPQDRVVAVEMELGRMFSSTGRHIPNVKKSRPGWDRLWLLPEEALFLVERGSLDLWWPTRPIEEILPATEREPGPDSDGQAAGDQSVPSPPRIPDPDDYDLGLPLSLQAAYALLIGAQGERGKVTLEKYQVYANLRRHGYIVLRESPVPRLSNPPHSNKFKPQTTLWQWLSSLLTSTAQSPPPLGPVVRPGFYRSYKQIFAQLAIIPRHKPDAPRTGGEEQPEHPFRIDYHVWKASGETFSKTRPRSPDFCMATVDARTALVPALDEISALLQSSPWDPPRDAWRGSAGHLYPRLKHGYRNVILAIVDHGLVNYLRFGEAAFGEEPIWQRFDSNVGPRGGKAGGARRGRGGGRGFGGRRGMGR